MAKQNTGWAIVGTIPVLGFILVLLAHKKDSYVQFYAKQGLVLGLTGLVLHILLFFIAPLVSIGTLVLWVISIVNASRGVMKPTPITGNIAKRLRL